MKKFNVSKRIMCVIIALCLIIPCIPAFTVPVGAETEYNSTAVADPSTANSYASMLGTDKDGNRYAGRIWFDKSVYTWQDKQTDLPLYLDFDKATADSMGIEIDSNFMVVGSALGSTTSVTTTTSEGAPVDVVIVLDNSNSMNNTVGGTTRFEKVMSAANDLIKSITENQQNRLAIVAYSGNSQTLLPLDYYRESANVLDINTVIKNNSTVYQFRATAVSASTNKEVKTTYTGSAGGTNVQSGINHGFEILTGAKNTSGRVPVVILLTDGVATYAVSNDWYNFADSNIHSDNNTFHEQVAVSTILNAAYMKYMAGTNYNTKPIVYGIGVDLGANSDASIVMDPAKVVVENSTGLAKKTYDLLKKWIDSDKTVESEYGGYTWRFPQLPTNYPGTKQNVIDNINYVDKYYNIGSGDLSQTFEDILVGISEKAFIPVIDTLVQGDIELDVPLTYVDFIGDYMEIKDFKAVTLFGKAYDITPKPNGVGYIDLVNEETGVITRTKTSRYVVGSANDIITNPVLGQQFKVSEAIKVVLKETYTVELNSDGEYVKTSIPKQELRVTAKANSVPLIFDKVANDNGDITFETNGADIVPLRIYYTVDICDEVVDANGHVIASKIDNEYVSKNTNNDGSINFYANRYGVMNPADKDGSVAYGDAHTAATPSFENRFYYYRNNYPVYITATNNDGSEIEWEEGEYGVLYYKGDGFGTTTLGKHKTEYLTYADVINLSDTDEIYHLVGFYRPTSGNKGEAVGYLTYAEWQYMKTDIAYYDNLRGVYINGYENGSFITSEDIGYAVDVSVIEAYLSENPDLDETDIICALAVESWRINRLHNMMVEKEENVTGTAKYSYVPTHNEDAIHDGNLVVWLGNNGKMSLSAQQGISVTKKVSEPVSGAEAVFGFTVTLSGTELEPKLFDENGNTVQPAEFSVNLADKTTVINISLANGEIVYITNLPAGTAYSVVENESDFYSPEYKNSVGTVTAKTVSDVTVTNAPKQFGNLIVSKEVVHDFDGNLANVFEFEITLVGITEKDSKNIVIPKGAVVEYVGGTAVIRNVAVGDDRSVMIGNIPAGTNYVVSEKPQEGFALNTSKTIGASGKIIANSSVSAEIVNDYVPDPITVTFSVSGAKTLQSNAEITEEFTFKLQLFNPVTGLYEDVDGAQASILVDATKAGAIKQYEFSFDTVYSTPGVHFYRVIELAGDNAHMTYDSTEGLFKVTVEDAGIIDGELVATVQSVSSVNTHQNQNEISVSMNFVNVYNAKGTHIEVPVKKILINETGVNIPLNSFSFVLEGEGNVYTTHSDAKGEAVFSIPVDSTGTYTYTLSEIDGNMAGMKYDPSKYTVTVVADEDNGEITAQVSISLGEKKVDVAEFTNTYSLGSVAGPVIKGTKILENKAITDNAFSFVISEADILFVPVEGGWSQTVSNKGNDFSFTLPEYTKVGTYRYAVSEVIPELAVDNEYKGITYDTTVYHLTVVVSVDSADATKLSVSYEISGLGIGAAEEISFTNVYEVKESKSVTFTATKVVDGRQLKGSEFSFGLFDKLTGELLAISTNLSTGDVRFAPITYTRSDIGKEYSYVVKEIIPDTAVDNVLNGVKYDTSEYTVNVSVIDDDEGHLIVLVDGKDGIVFRNEYSAKPASVTVSGVKLLDGKVLEDGEFRFVIKDQKGADIQTVSNGADGKIEFAPITFDKTGVYVYIVSEVNDNKGGVKYDETVYTVTVTVTDNEDGILIATTTVDGGREIVFDNDYLPKNAVIDIEGTKVLNGRPLENGEFSFAIYDAVLTENGLEKIGDEIFTVLNDAEGNFVFSNISFSSEGTYYFVVEEVRGDKEGVIYDETVYTVTVTVVDDGNGSLIATSAISGDGHILFNNEYEPSTPQLGDDGNMYLWCAAMLVGAVGMAALLFRKRRIRG